MALLSDETLMAYADGELDAAAIARVEAVLARDPEARERLEIFAATGAPLKELYSKPMEEPVPPHLVALVLCGKDKAEAPVRVQTGTAQSGGWLSALSAFFAPPQWAMVGGLAGLILVVGLSGGWYLRKIADPEGNTMQGLVSLDKGQIFARGAFARALETAPSGSPVALEMEQPGFTMRAALTFKNRVQNYCRQYDVKTPDGQYAGVACRGGDGQWRLDIHVAAAPQSQSGERTVPAGGRASSEVENAVNSVIEGDALGREDEAALIRNKWRQ